MAENKKCDMSKKCGKGLQDAEVKRQLGKISEQEFQNWYQQYCGRCIYQSETCMFGDV